MLADQYPGDRAERVEGLRQVQTARGTLCGPDDGHQRVGGGLEERKPTRDDEQRAQEEPIGAQRRGRVEEEGAGGIQEEADEESRLVAEAPHTEARRNREQEIAGVEGALHEAGAEVRQLEDFLELLDEDVVEVVGDAPQKEEADDEHKGVGCPRRRGGRHQALRHRHPHLTSDTSRRLRSSAVEG